jgi:outer membrane usher protein
MMYRWRPAVLAACAAVLVWPARVAAGGMPAPGATPATDARRQAPRQVYLRVILNGADTGLIVAFTQDQKGLSMQTKDMAALRLMAGDGVAVPGKTVRLDALPGLRYRYRADRQEVEMEVPDSLLRPHLLDMHRIEPVPEAQAGWGAVINYQAHATADDGRERGRGLGLWTEARLFAPAGVLTHGGVAAFGGRASGYRRYDTTWSQSDPASLRTVRVGDSISSSLAWSRPVRLGGLQWSRDFSLRPDLPAFALPSFSGSAAVPTAVDVYINDVRHYSARTPGGPFTVDHLAGLTGAGAARIETRDAFGRRAYQTLPIYIDTRLMAPGLTSYSAEAGWLRRYRGLRDFDYGGGVAASASLRHGLRDNLTAEGHAEAAAGLTQIGAGALWRPGLWGVFNASVSAATGRENGVQAGAGYQYLAADFAVDLQSTRSSPRYRDLAGLDGGAANTASNRLTFSAPFARRQTGALSYITMQYGGRRRQRVRIASASYALALDGRTTLNLSAFRNLARAHSGAVVLSLNIALEDGVNLSMNATHQRDGNDYGGSAERRPDDAGGWGWAADAGSARGQRYQEGQLQYLGRHGLVTATAQRHGQRRSADLDLDGALVLMDGAAYGTQRIDDAFALVSTHEADVPVLFENRLMGSTDASGHLIVPQLIAYRHNRIAIDAHGLSADASVASVERDIVPRFFSGVLAEFAVEHEAAAILTLVDADGQPLPVGTRLSRDGPGAHTVVGYDGVAFVRGLQDRNRYRAHGGGVECFIHFDFQLAGDGSLARIGPLPCLPR